jgi:HlyD family secretion protein
MHAELQKLRIEKEHKANRHQRSRWPWLVAPLAIVALLLVGWREFSAAAQPTVQTVRVIVPEGAVTDADLVMLNATGYVIAAHKIELASKVIGRVAWVGVEMGDKITRGQVLVRLEDDEYRARVAEEQGQLDNALAKLAELQAGSRPEEIETAQAAVDKSAAEENVAEINYHRVADLESSHSVSQQQIDDAQSLMNSRRAELDSQKQQLALSKLGPRKEEIDAQRATVNQLRGSLALAQVDLDDTVIRSPIAGTVLERNVEMGEFVTNGFVGDRGAKGYVLSIADLNDLRVDLDVSQNDFAKVSLHQPCWIVTDAYPDRRYEGDVDLISPEANRQKATVDVRVKIFNPDELLKPDMNATVSFLNSAKLATTRAAATMPAADRPVLRIPSGAVRDNSVFVVEDGKAIKRTVTAGSADSAGNIEITKGLIGGEDLIVDPPVTLADGQAVKVATEQ